MTKKLTPRRRRASKQLKASRLHLRHHRHSGRLLPHHQTSYLALGFLMAIVAALLISFMVVDSVGASTQVSSGSIGLTGLVKGPPPTVPAVISSPASGQTFSTNLITVSGTCGPDLVVKLFRNGALAGSQICQTDGTFSLTIQLLGGKNTLRARNFDFADQPGPDSPDVDVFWPQSAAAAASSVSSPSAGGGSNAAAVADFIVTTEKAYYVATVGNQMSWSLVVSGGQAPYALLIDWGDGQQELKSLTKAGTFDLSHTYKRAGQYKIIVKATDATGQTGYIQTTAIVQQPGVFGLPSQILPKTDRTDLYYASWTALMASAAGLFIFWLGERFGLRRKTLNTVTGSSRR